MENQKQSQKLLIYVIRHGKTENNTLGLLQGQGDSPLTEEGKSQVSNK